MGRRVMKNHIAPNFIRTELCLKTVIPTPKSTIKENGIAIYEYILWADLLRSV